MTTETQTAMPKQVPAFYIFAQDNNGQTIRIGAAFPHRKGKGFSILIGNRRYSVFPPKAKPETQTEEGA